MLYRLYCITFVLIFLLVACSGNSQTFTPQAQVSAITIAPSSTDTLIPVPSGTPLPTTTMTATASITPTPTVTPENFVLADSGSDIANVSISYSSEDVVNIDFKYRLDTKGKRSAEQMVSWLLLPGDCQRVGSESLIYLNSATGHGHLAYKQVTQGRCEVPYFDVVIGFRLQVPGNITDKIVYQERINQPLAVVRNIPAITSNTLTVKNFSFKTTGPWSGKFSFEYAFLPEIPVTNEAYRFALSGMGGVFVCEFYAWGPVIKETEGHYTINIDFYSTQDFRIMDPTCAIKYDTLIYDVSVLYLEDLRSSSQVRIYQHAIDFPITLMKSP